MPAAVSDIKTLVPDFCPGYPVGVRIRGGLRVVGSLCQNYQEI